MPDPSHTKAALVFWAADSLNNYEFMISGNGYYSVRKLIEGNWSTPIDWFGSNALKTGIGNLNLLRVLTSGDKVSCYINGVQVVRNLALAPLGKHFGLAAGSPKAAVAKIEFSDLKVVQPTS
jgi:hypothetical protein